MSNGIPRRLVLLFCLVLGTFFGVSGYTFIYAKGYSYLSNDPKACANCHVMRDHFDAWEKSSHHAAATCNDCHVPAAVVSKYVSKMRNGFWHSKGFTFQDFPDPIRIRPVNSEILRQNCLRCHAELVDEIVKGVPRAHPATSDIQCVKCHMIVGHDPIR